MRSNKIDSRGMRAVLAGQFLSALADNALLFASIAMLRVNLAPNWQIPLLQEGFIIAFIVLSPFVGSFSDAWPKGHVLLVSNGIKFCGALAMLLGLNPLIAYMLVGIGAAPYSPAKYGILSELVSAELLVKANGMMEGTTIIAILLGSVLGGKLSDVSLTIALVAICLCYLLAAASNFMIPRLPAAHGMERFSVNLLVKDFWIALVSLSVNKDARFSLIGTSVFWGTASTLRVLLVAWVPVALDINEIGLPANLSGVVAVGIAIGAAMASGMISLNNVNRVLPAGIMLGIGIILLAHATSLTVAILLLVIVGVLGGFYMVPLNALLQERGEKSVGAGHAVAVQSFVENCVMLLFVGLYMVMNKMGMPVVLSASIFGGMVLAAVGLLGWFRIKKG